MENKNLLIKKNSLNLSTVTQQNVIDLYKNIIKLFMLENNLNFVFNQK